MNEELEYKLSYQQRASRGMEMDAIEKHRPKTLPWWLLLISLFVAFLVFFLASALFKAKGGLIIEGAVSLIAFIIPGYFWRNSKKYNEQERIYNEKIDEIDRKYFELVKKNEDK